MDIFTGSSGAIVQNVDQVALAVNFYPTATGLAPQGKFQGFFKAHFAHNVAIAIAFGGFLGPKSVAFQFFLADFADVAQDVGGRFTVGIGAAGFPFNLHPLQIHAIFPQPHDLFGFHVVLNRNQKARFKI